MKERQFTKKCGAAILGLMMLIGIGFTFATTAQAQSRGNPSFNKDPNSESLDAQRYREEELNRRFSRAPVLKPSPRPRFDTLEAKVQVTNRSTNEIRAVSWVVSFTDPGTGALLATRDVVSKSRIAPGKKKTLEKSVPVPRVLRAGLAPRRSRLVIVTGKVASVTYADGSTSNTP